MRLVVPALLALAACFLVQTTGASRAAAQVVISGQITSYSTTAAPPAAAPAPSGYVATGAPAPVRYIHRSQSMPALWVPGMIGLIGGWAVNVLGLGWYLGPYGASGYGLEWYLYGLVPVIGPWLQFAVSDPAGNQFPEWSAITGVLEGAGLVLLILGLTIRDEWDEPVYTFNEADPHSPTLAFNLGGAPGGGTMATLTLSHF
jgi:hypothetical protein